MPLRPVVTGIGAEDDASVRCYGRRGRTIIENTPGSGLVGSRIDAEVRALSAAAWSTDRQQHSAAIVQTVSQRGLPFQREVWVDRDQVIISCHKMAAANRVNGAVRRDRGRDVDPWTLGAARSCRSHCVRAGWPRKLAVAEPEFAWISCRRSIGRERRESHFTGRAIRRDLNQPRVDHIVVPRPARTEFDSVVVNVAIAIRAERTSHKDVHVLRGSERVNGPGGCTVLRAELRDCASRSRHVNEITLQHWMEDRLPKRSIERNATRKRNRFPVGCKTPYLHQLTVLPGESLLRPVLRFPVGCLCEVP